MKQSKGQRANLQEKTDEGNVEIQDPIVRKIYEQYKLMNFLKLRETSPNSQPEQLGHTGDTLQPGAPTECAGQAPDAQGVDTLRGLWAAGAMCDQGESGSRPALITNSVVLVDEND